MRYIFLLFLIFGCSSKPSYIYVKEPQIEQTKGCNCSIAVKEVELPYYLEDAKIPYISDGKIEFFGNSYFAEDAKEFATKRVRDILTTTSKDASIYPWNSKKSDYILQLDVRELIAKEKDSKVKIFAKWKLFNQDKDIVLSSTCRDTMSLQDFNKKEVLNGMRELFDRCIDTIARKIGEI